MNTLINVVAVVAFFGGVVVIATYSLLAPWWRSHEGVNAMSFTAAATGLLGLRCLTMIFGDGFWGQNVLRLLFIAAVGVVMWHRWGRIVKLQLGNLHRDVASRE